jgi:hypothetical protein
MHTLWSILGWSTVGADVLLGGWLMQRLWVVGTRPWTWQRPVPIPKFATGIDVVDPVSGSDYVGLV